MPDSGMPPLLYTEGGPLPSGSPLYVTREHEEQFADAYRRGKIVYILAPRQSGKTSLLYWMRNQLIHRGDDCVMIDFSLIGLSGSADSDTCFYTMSSHIVNQLNPDFDLDRWWNQQKISFAARLREVLRLTVSRTKKNLAVFIDEFDVLALRKDLSAFFLALRALANEQQGDHRQVQIRFAMAGTFPSNRLIANPAMTPFNISEIIELRDFTFEQARTLTLGWKKNCETSADYLLKSVLDWAGGHPFLTHCMCSKISELGANALGMTEMKGQLEQSFESVRRQLEAIARAVPFYRRVQLRALYQESYTQRDGARLDRRGPWVQSIEQELFEELRVAGIVRERAAGRIEVRNRLYRECFPPGAVGECLNLAFTPTQWWWWLLGRFASRPETGVKTLGIMFAVAIASALLAWIAYSEWTAAETNEKKARADEAKVRETAQKIDDERQKFNTKQTMSGFTSSWLFGQLAYTKYNESLPLIEYGTENVAAAPIVKVLHSIVMDPPFEELTKGASSVYFPVGGRYAFTWFEDTTNLVMYDLCDFNAPGIRTTTAPGEYIIAGGVIGGRKQQAVLDVVDDYAAIWTPRGIMVGHLSKTDEDFLDLPEPPVHLALSSDTKLLAAVTKSGSLMVWRRRGVGGWRRIDGSGPAGVTSVAFVPKDDALLVAGSSGAGLALVHNELHYNDFPVPNECSQFSHELNGLALSHPNGEHLALASDAGGIVYGERLDPSTWRCVSTGAREGSPETPGAPIRSVAFYSHGGHLGGNTDKGEFYFWDAEDRSVDISIPFGGKKIFDIEESGFTRDAELFYWIKKDDGPTRFYTTYIMDLKRIGCLHLTWGKAKEPYSSDMKRDCSPFIEEICGASSS